MHRWSRWGLAVLFAAAMAQIALPLGSATKDWSYLVVAVAAIAMAVGGVVRNRPARPRGWILVVGGFAGWALGDVVWTMEQRVFQLDIYPVPSDALYLASYVILGCGIMSMVRTQRQLRQIGGILDITIIATGLSVFVASAVILPLTHDTTLTLAGKVVSSAYPIGDIFLLVAASQLWTTPGARSRSYGFLLLSLLCAFVPDLSWSGVVYITSDNFASNLSDALWLVVYVLVAVAACEPSMKALGQPNQESEGATAARRRLALLAIGLLMPACALLAQNSAVTTGGLPLIGIGAVVLSVLTLLRMSSLLGVIEGQTVQLAALASCDALTGAPNRRTWDHELSSACRTSKELGAPLSIALIDLDQFKRFNDRHGHQAGDLLLREAVAAWTSQLGDRGLLARYGGEEFAVLLPKMNVDAAVSTISALRSVMPSGQTFSAGVSSWTPGMEPTQALAQADRGLYNAKRAGRDRVMAYPSTELTTLPEIPVPTIVLQPIVDLRTGRVAGHEALSRFGDKAPEAVFRLAGDLGYGDILEAQAIALALALPGRPDLPLHVNASAGAMTSERFWELLPDDLTGIVVEISERYDHGGLDSLCQTATRLRAAGARIATDDLGRGSDELYRLAAVRPDVVKIDRSLVEGCADDPGRQAVILGALAFTRALGGEVCTEGASDVRDLEQLRAMGVRFSQCFLLGVPTPEWGPAYVDLPFAQPLLQADLGLSPGGAARS